MNATTVDSSRIKAFDLARGLAVLLMMLIHTLDFYGSSTVHETMIGASFKAFVGWPAASTFVFIMGIFVAYTPNATLAQGLKRAAMLFALGYVLNLFRGTIPMWLSIQMGLVTYEDLGPHTPLTEFLIVDVLQFAGIAFAVCSLLQHYLPNPKYWLATALLVNFVSPLLWDISTGNLYLDELLQIFWGYEAQGAIFPQFPWLTYPLVGMAFGGWLKTSSSLPDFFRRSFWIATTGMVIGLGIIFTDVEFHLADSLRGGPGLIICISCFTILVLCACQFIVNSIPHNPIFAILYTWSKYVTVVYIIQWLLVGWGLMIFGLQTMNSSQVLMAMLGVVVLSDLGMRVWVKATTSNNIQRHPTTSNNIKIADAQASA
ncbi:multipass membrane protein [Oleiphilus messinensis]|uniref:Multipass membrane protein n=1 Tax=Oleiphilus messinensis TaxID=141451 RepID=A0A1Y0IG97_9GAMM|nr:heparan-alpha-glucosaminide N-acetyltransferase domain-containing protein [Oleiphilus messinensis]ARU59159.1 multipass membrane protein [Oleiphilus messinensis]